MESERKSHTKKEKFGNKIEFDSQTADKGTHYLEIYGFAEMRMIHGNGHDFELSAATLNFWVFVHKLLGSL